MSSFCPEVSEERTGRSAIPRASASATKEWPAPCAGPSGSPARRRGLRHRRPVPIYLGTGATSTSGEALVRFVQRDSGLEIRADYRARGFVCWLAASTGGAGTSFTGESGSPGRRSNHLLRIPFQQPARGRDGLLLRPGGPLAGRRVRGQHPRCADYRSVEKGAASAPGTRRVLRLDSTAGRVLDCRSTGRMRESAGGLSTRRGLLP